MRRKITAALLFLLGLSIVMYPPFSKMYYDIQIYEEVGYIVENFDNQPDHFYQQQIEYNQNSISNSSNIEIANVGYVDTDNNESESQSTSIAMNDISALAAGNADNSSNRQAEEYDSGVLGTLHISKINLVYPIYDGATDENLLKGVARIEGTSYPVGGINTNSVIAGHSSMATRNYFTHIKELVNGDIIQIRNQKEVLTYEVYATAIIEPDDTAALAVISGQDTLTLLTCTWPPPGTHRYLVYSRRISDRPLESFSYNK